MGPWDSLIIKMRSLQRLTKKLVAVDRVVQVAKIHRDLKKINQVDHLKMVRREKEEKKDQKEAKMTTTQHPQQRLKLWRFAKKSSMKSMWMLVTSWFSSRASKTWWTPTCGAMALKRIS